MLWHGQNEHVDSSVSLSFSSWFHSILVLHKKQKQNKKSCYSYILAIINLIWRFQQFQQDLLCFSIVVILCGKKVCRGLSFLVHVKFSKFVKKIVMIERSMACMKIWSVCSQVIVQLANVEIVRLDTVTQVQTWDPSVVWVFNWLLSFHLSTKKKLW